MSYAIAPTFEGNRMGVRRLRTISGLGGLRGLGDAAGDQYAAALIQGGADPGTISTLQALGATSAQLAALYDGSTDVPSLMMQLTSTVPPYNPASPQNPVMNATISTAFGVYDLTQQSSWNAINSLFTSTQQNLTGVARQAPSDPTVVSLVNQFNALVQKWAGYYNQAFGNNPSPMPTVTLSGLGIAPVIVGALATAGIVAALYTLYTVNQAIDVWKAAQANKTALLQQYQAAVASGNSTAASQLLAAIQANNSGTSSTSALAWISANWPYIAAGGFAFMFLGMLGEKRL